MALAAPPDERISGETNGMPYVTIATVGASGCAATVYLHGGHVASWTVAGQEMLFMSKSAVYNGSKALRGGIPVCFPQFGDLGPCQAQHGFARNLPWTLLSKEEGQYSATVRLSLCSCQPDSEWPHPYVLTNTVTIEAGGVFKQELAVANPGAAPFTFTTALHTYFRVAAAEATLSGLSGATYLDSLDGRAAKQDSDAAVSFPGEVDRIYHAVPRTGIALADSRRRFEIATTAEFADAVVWNPHVAKAASMSDYGDDEWQEHVCHEVARTAQPVTLAPGEMWSGAQVVRVFHLKQKK